MNAFDYLREKVRSRADRCGTYGTCVPDVSILQWIDEAEAALSPAPASPVAWPDEFAESKNPVSRWLPASHALATAIGDSCIENTEYGYWFRHAEAVAMIDKVLRRALPPLPSSSADGGREA